MQSRYKKIPKTPSAINILPYSLQRNISSYANLPYSERADLRREDIVWSNKKSEILFIKGS